MRNLVFLVAVAVGTASFDVPIAAAAGQACRGSDSATAIDCGGDKSSTALVDQPVLGSSSKPSTSGPAKKYEFYDRLMTAADGKPCLTVGYREVGTASADQAPAIPLPGTVNPINGLYESCPATPVRLGEPSTGENGSSPVETRAMFAARYWERIPLPKPQPAIAPGRAITGKLAYLETKGQLAYTYTNNNNTMFGALEIVAKGAYSVDWGDGETSGPYSFEGQPWPDGEITHEYIDVGDYNVVVTEKWTATWAMGGESGSLRSLQTVGRIDNFPVQQIQAVVVVGP